MLPPILPPIFDITASVIIFVVLLLCLAGVLFYLRRRRGKTRIIEAPSVKETASDFHLPAAQLPTATEKTYTRAFGGHNVSVTFAIRDGKFALAQTGVGAAMASSGHFRKWIKECVTDFSKVTGSEVNLKDMAAGLLSGGTALAAVTSEADAAPCADFEEEVDGSTMTFRGGIGGSHAKLVVVPAGDGYDATFYGVGFSKLKSNQSEFTALLASSSDALSTRIGKKAMIQATPDVRLKQYRFKISLG